MQDESLMRDVMEGRKDGKRLWKGQRERNNGLEKKGIFLLKDLEGCNHALIVTRQVTRATHMRNHVCPRVELILKIIIILLIIFLEFIKSKPC